jgi:hypothetical protein
MLGRLYLVLAFADERTSGKNAERTFTDSHVLGAGNICTAETYAVFSRKNADTPFNGQMNASAEELDRRRNRPEDRRYRHQ